MDEKLIDISRNTEFSIRDLRKAFTALKDDNELGNEEALKLLNTAVYVAGSYNASILTVTSIINTLLQLLMKDSDTMGLN